MKAGLASTLAATVIATVVGTGLWLTGFAKVIWPAHPLVAAFLITIVVTISVKKYWPVKRETPLV